MKNSTTRKAPQKPRPDFPLFPHATGRWAKKVRGRLVYFGKWADDPMGEAALDRWLDEKDDLLAGRLPRAKCEELTVAALCNHFLAYKEQLRDSGELTPRTFDRYYAACEFLVDNAGRNRMVSDLRPDDFQVLRAKMAKRWGPVAMANEIQMIRSVLRYGYEAELIDRPIRLGPGFKKPSAKVIRGQRAANGPRLFAPIQLRELLANAGPNMRCMMLLGINGGLGNTDVAELTINAADLRTGWLNYPRKKTGIMRRIPLWSETVKAWQDVLKRRREPNKAEYARLLFIGARGENYIGNHKGYRVTQEFARIANATKVAGRTFYDLRRTFQTIGESAGDLVAVQSIMGHAPISGDMSAVYRQGVEDDRLRHVVDHVRKWLFGGAPRRKSGQASAKPRRQKQTKKPTELGDDRPKLRVIG